MSSAFPTPALPLVYLQATGDTGASRWLCFARPLEVLVAYRLDEVLPIVAAVERGVERGLYAAGFLSYEAGPAFDPALAAHPPPGAWPLAWWGLFPEPTVAEPPTGNGDLPALAWRSRVRRADYFRAVAAVRRHIAAGDTYQANYTFPLEARFTGNPLALFAAMRRAQPPVYGAYLDLGRFVICSASPELFFTLDGDRLVARPMKGTAPRGRDLAEDRDAAARLAASPKDQAENVMIVDMVRNDLGRIAVPGSVQVEELFAVATYPTLHQMTSTVTARSDAAWRDVLTALFPSASITGAPKVRTSEILRALEPEPRGVYTGTLGFLAPGRRAQHNVAIRTLALDRREGRARYGIGSGIVWDSRAASEYAECRTKALVVMPPSPDFELLETLRWQPRTGFFLLARHLERLARSAAYFGFSGVDPAILGQALNFAAKDFPPVRHRVRLRCDRRGRLAVEATPWPCTGRTVWSVRLADQPVRSSDPFLFHKTTRREVYDAARARQPEVDEVVLWNEKRELTEATRANLLLRLDGTWLTPAGSSGLLAGVYRGELLARGRIREATLPVEAFAEASEVCLVNALRGWIRVHRL